MIVSSFGVVQALAGPSTHTWSGSSSPSGTLPGMASSYSTMYRTQPQVRTVVDFIARNVAQLGLHVFRRVDDNDRERLIDHGLAQLIKRPNPWTTRYRMIETTMQDLGVYFNAFWLKIHGERLGVMRLPPEEITVEGTLYPTSYLWSPSSRAPQRFAPGEVVHFSGYDPLNSLLGISPLETLRYLLAEESAANAQRRAYWNNAARMEGVIERPLGAPPWDATQRATFRDEWQAAHGGSHNAGKSAILEDGMTWRQVSYSAQESELTATRKLSREEVAAAYHVPPPMVGILEHATFSNVTQQHKQLYQDTLGPWLVMLEEEFDRQLLYEFDDVADVYVEFNIAEKLKGSFDEQARAIRTLVGRPIMTANEGRARLNLPAMENDDSADELAVPMNVEAGWDELAPPAPVDASSWPSTLHTFWSRQAKRIEKDAPHLRALHFDLRRWNAELAADLMPLYEATGIAPEDAFFRSAQMASVINDVTRAMLLEGQDPFTPDREIPTP